MGTGRLSSFSIAGAGWRRGSTRPPRAQQEWLGSATGMAGNRRGFCRSLLLGVNGGSFGRRRCSFCWLHRDERRRARRTVTGGVASSHMSCSRLLYLEVFFSPLKLFRWCFVSCFSAYSSPPGWDSCPRLPRRQRSCATRSCAALLFALRVGRGNPTTRQENENDGRGGVTDDHLRRMRLSRPPRPTYSVSYL